MPSGGATSTTLLHLTALLVAECNARRDFCRRLLVLAKHSTQILPHYIPGDILFIAWVDSFFWWRNEITHGHPKCHPSLLLHSVTK